MKRHPLKHLAVLITGLLFAMFLLVSTSAKAEEVEKIPITLSVSLSGSAAPWGIGADRGVTLAVEEINKKGGVVIKGKKYMFEHKAYDHAYNPAKAVEIAKRAISVDKSKLFLTLGAATIVGVVPFLEEGKVITAHCGTGSDVLYKKGKPQDYTFKFISSLLPEVTFMIWDYLSKAHPEIKKVAGIYPDDASGWGDADVHKKYLSRYGVELVTQEFYKRGIEDFYPLLNRMLAKNPDLIDMASDPPGDSGRMLKQARELGYKGIMLTECSGTYLDPVKIAGKAAEGYITETHGVLPGINPAAPGPIVAQYKEWSARWGADSYEALGTNFGEAVLVFAQALEKAQTFDPDKIMDVIRTSEFTAWGLKFKMVGQSMYGYKCILSSPQTLVKIVDGKPVILKMLELPPTY